MTPAQEGMKAARRDDLIAQAARLLQAAKEMTRDDEHVVSKALWNSLNWLDDVNRPLTEAEEDIWEEVGQGHCYDMFCDLDSNGYADLLNTFDKRCVVEQHLENLREEANEKLIDFTTTG